MNKKLKFASAFLVTTLLVEPVVTLINDNNIILAREKNTINEQIKLKKFLKYNFNLSNKESEDVIKFLEKIKEEGYNSPEARERGKFAILRGIFKVFVRNVDAIPSKTIRRYIDTHGYKIIEAVDYIEETSTAGFTIAFESAGIPYPQARLLAEFVVFFVL
ncbi:hypothetical protein KMP11_05900 [Gemella sp. zg-570]|uniref:hypothetical protein n=1 Tax=Gemella sp. zg-570 TaxID=2840371 RepID=UPI001C0D2FDA|nr:hypothetical protein [Gemella sp. zg-570]QWQ38485.1 hypothetical protein KMP11_05900 [Gemella sp. zg-570]